MPDGLRPALLRYADLAFDLASYPRAVVAYRAFVAQEPTSPEVVHALERVYESHVRNAPFDEARAQAGAIAVAPADGSPWQRANASDPHLLANARALVERVSAQYRPADRPDARASGELDPGEELRALRARRGTLGACLWGSGDAAHTRPTTVRLAVVIGVDGLLVEATATTPSRSAAVERCVADRSRTIQFPAPSFRPASFDVWLVAR